VLDCATSSFKPGLYRLSDLHVTVLRTARPQSDFPAPLEPVEKGFDVSVYAPNVDAFAHNSGCFPLTVPWSKLGFSHVADRGYLTLWVRDKASEDAPPRRRRRKSEAGDAPEKPAQ